MYEASKRFVKRVEDDKTLYILYLGDHDPSGIDMTRDVSDRIELFVKTALNFQQGENEPAVVEIQRLALNMDQVEELQPPENPAKITDSRASAYIRRFGPSSWELDAIEPRRLADLVSKAIRKLVDLRLWDASGEVQQSGRDYIAKMARTYKP
jgi:hypothetical protein